MNFLTEQQDNYNDVLKKLQDYMLTENTIQNSLSLKQAYTRAPDTIKKTRHHLQKLDTTAKQNRPFEPREKDSLFWCFFIMKNGMTDYEMLEHRNFIVEKKIKIEYVEQLRKTKQLVKSYKLATLTHVESKLANDDKIDVQTMLTMCVLENINVMFIKKHTYYELLMNDGDEFHIIHCLDKYKFGYEVGSKIKSEQYKSTLFRIDNFDKPLKSISSYKLPDLVDICKKLNIDTVNTETNKQKNKSDLYESIVQYL